MKYHQIKRVVTFLSWICFSFVEMECLQTTCLINFEDPCYGAEWIIVPYKVYDVMLVHLLVLKKIVKNYLEKYSI